MDAIAKPQDSLLSTRDRLLQRYYLQEEQDTHLRDYWRIILKHRWIVLTFFVIIATTVAIYTFTVTPIYRASATIKIDREPPQILFKEIGASANSPDTQEYMGTHHKLLQSRSLAKRVIDVLRASDHSYRSGQPGIGVSEMMGHFLSRLANPAKPRTSEPPHEAEPNVAAQQADFGSVDAILPMLAIEPVRGSNLVKITFTAPSPQLTALLANTWAKAYIDQSLEMKYNATTQATEWLSKQLQEVLTKLEQSELKLHTFAKAKEILTIGEKKDIVTTKLGDLSEALTRAQGERIAKEALYRQSQGQGFESIPLVLENGLISELKAEYYKLDNDYQRFTETYKPDYPKMVRMREGINQLKRRLDTEIQRVVEGIKQEFEAAKKREQLLVAAVEEQKRLAIRISQDFIQYDILKREVDTNRHIYTSILERLKQAGVSQGLATSTVQIVDNAEIPRVPFRPNKIRNLLLGIVLGLTVGIGLAFFFDYLDNTMKTPEDLERTLGIPSLALIPALSSVTPRKAIKRTQNGHPIFELIAHTDLRGVLTEAFRNLRTAILYSSPGPPPKSILFTSAQVGEGKTGVSINTSITLSQLGGTVLLIDGDMRRPACHSFLEIPIEPGLSDYLAGHADLISIIKRTSLPHLYCIPAGTIPVNPAELLASARMRETIDLLSQRFDHIVLDAPPAVGVADTLILSTLVQGVILIAHSGRTPRELVQRALKNLVEVNATILGAVLNNVKSNGYPYYHYHDSQSPLGPTREGNPEEHDVAYEFPTPIRGGGKKPE